MIKFVKINIHHFLSHECLKSAAALSFTTILGIVPIIALFVFSVSQFLSATESQLIIQDSLLKIFSPAAGEELQTKLLTLAGQASELRIFGLSVLVVTILLGLNTIDLTINAIWDIKRCKRTIFKLALYFLVLMAIPILLAISLSVSSYVLSITVLGQTLGGGVLNSIMLKMAPVVVTWVAFVCIYVWIPNTKVDTKAAFIGGAVAAILFEIAKILFLIYIRYFPTYDLIYGTFAVLPLFFIWVYISWLIVLAGAVLTFNVAKFNK